MRRLLSIASVMAVAAASITSLAAARHEAASFNCPKSATAKGTTLWVRNHNGFRGSSWCNDGAVVKASLSYSGKTESLAFPGGLCTKDRNGRHFQAGTRISPDSARKPKDPPGFFIKKAQPAHLEDSVSIGNSKWKWSEAGVWDQADSEPQGVKVTWNKGALKGSFAGVAGLWLNNEYTLVKATGTFTCKRIVATGF